MFGVDLWEHQLRQAMDKEVYEGLSQVNLLDGLPFKEDSFDVVVCNQVLMYLPDAPGMAAEFYRVLRPGGKVFVSNPISRLPGLMAGLKRLSRKIYQERRTVSWDNQKDWKDANRACRITYYSFRSFVEEIASAGFTVTEAIGFRIFRNRIRAMTRLEDYEWYRRAVKSIAARYPQFAADILITAVKEQS
jgi:ubiquinone/menaquinone biosynthesis C-methylase UbiE